MDSDVVIYDLMTADYDEVDHVIKTFKTSEYDEEKTLILISSVMTWVNTPPKIKKEGEEPPEGEEEELTEPDSEGEGDDQAEPAEGEEAPPQVLNFKEKDFHLRVPSP